MHWSVLILFPYQAPSLQGNFQSAFSVRNTGRGRKLILQLLNPLVNLLFIFDKSFQIKQHNFLWLLE